MEMQRLDLVTLAVLTTVGCYSPTEAVLIEPHPDQAVLFQAGHVNWAWGAVNRGVYIDAEGAVWELSEAFPWWEEVGALRDGRVPTGSYPAAALNAFYEENRTSIVGVISREVLLEKFRLISAAAEGPYSEEMDTGRDMGLLMTGALMYDPTEAVYRKVVLGVWGDATIENKSVEGSALHEWLRAVFRQHSFR
jgi:hypothetical protein